MHDAGVQMGNKQAFVSAYGISAAFCMTCIANRSATLLFSAKKAKKQQQNNIEEKELSEYYKRVMSNANCGSLPESFLSNFIQEVYHE